MQGRSSERILPLQHLNNVNLNAIVRNRPNPAANRSPLPLYTSGRTLPSKWDDAERWICSPVVERTPPANNPDGIRKPKSKSGPLCRPNFQNLSSSSSSHAALVASSSTSAMYCLSPFDTGTTTADKVLLRFRNGILDEIFNGNEQGDDEATDPRAISRRDMATQMSPMSSICCSPKAGASFSPNPSPRGEFPVRPDDGDGDVAIEKPASIISRLKRPGKHRWTDSRDPPDGFSPVVVEASSWQFEDAAKDTSWGQREEARIAAWENLQKAKAEAAIQKLEMKLEKKRSSSMERIMSKLRAAQRKAREMRESLSEDSDPSRRTKPLSSWFRCDAF